MSEQVIGVNTALMHGFTNSLIKYVNDIVEQNDSNNDNKEDYYLFFVDFLKNLIESSQQELKNSISSADKNSDLFLETQLWNLFYHLINTDTTLVSELDRILNIRTWLESMMEKPKRPAQSIFESKNMFFKYLFELVISGQYDLAIKEALSAKNYNLAMILNGFKAIEISEDSVADGLWKNSVKVMGDDTKLSAYERVLYKYISGSSLTLLDEPLQEIVNSFDWSIKLLFHVKSIIDDYVEAKTKNFASFGVKEKLENSLYDVFSSEEIKNPIKDIIYSLISNKLDILLVSFEEELQDSLNDKKTSFFYGNEYLLRIMAQLCIISSTIDRDVINKDIKDTFISVYIKSLIVDAKETSQPEILNSIYAYIYYLEPDNQLEIYSEFLKYIDSTADKKKQKIAAEALGLPFKSFLMKMSTDLFADMKAKDLEKSEIVKSQSMNDDITDEQNEIINCIDYLIVADYYERAIDLLLSSIKLFLIKKSVGAFVVLMDKIDLDKIITVCELNDKTEESQVLQDFAKLKICLVLLKEWNVYVKDLEQSNDIVEFTNKEQLLTVKLTQCAMESFDFVNSEDDNKALFLVKCIYVPYLFIQIHKILEFSSELLGQPSLAQDALDLAKIVTDKTKQYHYLFNSSHTLELYVEMVTKTYIKVLDEE
jgi:nuclear pore complex protein Nup107